jgi:hypothetical protein
VVEVLVLQLVAVVELLQGRVEAVEEEADWPVQSSL